MPAELLTRWIGAVVCLATCGLSVAQDGGGVEEESGFWESFRERLYVSGTLESEFGLQTSDGSAQKWETQLQPEFEIYLPKDVDLTIIPRLRFDPVDELYPDQPNQPERSGPDRIWTLGDPLELELRELYVQSSVGDTYLTIGKQQVVWGKSDGLKVLDVVNPQDFREFVLDDFDDSRIPLWTVNAEIPIKDVTLQLLWIPDPTYHDLPEPGSPFVFESNVPQAPPGVDVVFNDPNRPNDPITGSDAGARLSTFWKGWDLTLNYFYFYDDVPALYRTIDLAAPTPTVTVNPRYERAHLLGTTFSNAFGNLTLRGEVGYTFGRYFPVENPSDNDGVHQSDELGYVIGLDWFGFDETVLSFQFFQNVMVDSAPGLLRDQIENTISLLYQRDFRNDTLVFSTIWVHSLNDNDGFIRPKLEYDVGTYTNVWAGFDLFYGTSNGLFGQFEDSSRVVFGVEYSFG